MGRISNHDQLVIDKAVEACCNAKDIKDLRAAQSILLPALGGITLTDTAKMLGVSRATTGRLQQAFRSHVYGTHRSKSGWGGRRRGYLSLEQEREFVSPWLKRCQDGGVLIVPPIHTAYEKRIGHKVAPSTVYRLLARHRWRKLTPDTAHPKSDPAAQEAYKKTSKSSQGSTES